MRTLLRAVMYAVAVVAGVDAYLVGVSLAGKSGLPAGWAQVVAVIVGAMLALIVATVPIAIYQRVMRRIVARRRAARFATASQPADLELVDLELVDLEPEPTDVRPLPRSNQTFGVTSRENRALAWPASNRLSAPAPQPIGSAFPNR